MRNTIVRCGNCSAALSIPETTGAGGVACRRCGTETRVWLFPALYRAAASSPAQPLTNEGDSSCMNHPQKRAVAVCDGCGKYLCALCDVDWSGGHLCPACIEHRKRADPEGALRTEYVHYDLIVLLLAMLGMLLWMFGLFIAPVALFLGWRYWNTPLRPVPHRKWTMVMAITLAAAVFIIWLSFLVFVIVSS